MTVEAQNVGPLVRAGLGLLNKKERWSALAVFSLMVATGLVESMVVSLVVPLIIATLDPERLASIAVIGPYARYLGTSYAFVSIIIAMLFLLVGSAVLALATLRLIEWHGARCKERITESLIALVMSAPMTWLARKNVTELSRQIFFDVNVWRVDLIQALMTIAQSLAIASMPLIAVIFIAPKAGLAVLSLAGLSALGAVVMSRKRIVYFTTQYKKSTMITLQRLVEMLSGVRDVKMSGNIDYFTQHYLRGLKVMHTTSAKAKVWATVPPVAVMLVGQCGFLIAAFVLWNTGASGLEIASTLGMLGIVVARIVPALNRVVSQVGQIYRATPFVRDLLDLMSELEQFKKNDQNDLDAGTLSVPKDWKTVDFENVGFSFPGAEAPALKQVSFRIQRGGTYGIVGQSGSGKSTLANLLISLYKPDSGSITIDGRPLREYKVSEWMRRIGFVPQDPYILDSTIGANVRFGTTHGPDDASILKALELAHLGSLGGTLTEVAERTIGERGKRVSGGQFQRIAIARALYRESELLLLDEATAALDSITERRIFDNLKEIPSKLTVVMIAHRLSTLKRCDKIFVLEGGKLIAQGNWDELLASSSGFRALVAAGEKDDETLSD